MTLFLIQLGKTIIIKDQQINLGIGGEKFQVTPVTLCQAQNFKELGDSKVDGIESFPTCLRETRGTLPALLKLNLSSETS